MLIIGLFVWLSLCKFLRKKDGITVDCTIVCGKAVLILLCDVVIIG